MPAYRQDDATLTLTRSPTPLTGGKKKPLKQPKKSAKEMDDVSVFCNVVFKGTLLTFCVSTMTRL